jgi:hypothetical protein
MRKLFPDANTGGKMSLIGAWLAESLILVYYLVAYIKNLRPEL